MASSKQHNKSKSAHPIAGAVKWYASEVSDQSDLGYTQDFLVNSEHDSPADPPRRTDRSPLAERQSSRPGRGHSAASAAVNSDVSKTSFGLNNKYTYVNKLLILPFNTAIAS